MFSDSSIKIIRRLCFDSSAGLHHCMIPLGSIYWDDELPEERFSAFSHPDRDLVLRVFSIRISLWNKEKIGESDLLFFEKVRMMFPHWPLFQRLQLNRESQIAHEKVQQSAFELLSELSEKTSDSLGSSDCTGSFNATVDLEDK